MDNNIIYTYYSVETFMTVIKNHTIRLSEITKSNDSAEVKWILPYIKDILMSEFKNAKETVKSFSYPEDVFEYMVNHYIGDYYDEPQYIFLVACFSSEGDLLSQWRGYADDAKGISVGYNRDFIEKISGAPDLIGGEYFEFGDIEYKEISQKKKIRENAKVLIKELKQLAKNGYGDSIRRASMPAFNRCFFKIYCEGAFMKNPFFKEEKESRICYIADREYQKPVSYKLGDNDLILATDASRVPIVCNEKNYGYLAGIQYKTTRGNTLVAYRDFEFNVDKSFEPKAISRIVIGPKCDISVKEIQNLLLANGIEYSVDIVKSKGTYR